MNKRTLVAILGITVTIISILGLPGVWKKQIFIVLGIVIAYLALSRGKKKVTVTPSEPEVDKTIKETPVINDAPTPVDQPPQQEVVPKPRTRRIKPTITEQL